MHVVLVEPEIPWNTGNIGRTCVAVGATLHLVGRLGFDVSEKEIRRSGLDYWPKLRLARHDSYEAFERSLPAAASLLFFSAAGERSFFDAPYERESYLVFGRESTGLPAALLERHAERVFRVPQGPRVRSLNLSTAAAVALYEGVRRFGLEK